MMRFSVIASFVLLLVVPASAAPPITAVCFSADGRQVITAREKSLAVYEWPSLELRSEMRISLAQATHVSFSPDGSQLLVVGGHPADSGSLQLLPWPLKPQAEPTSIVAGDDVLFQSAWIDQDNIAVAGTDGHLALVNFNGQSARSLKGHSRHVLCVEVSTDSKLLFSGSDDTSLRVWNLESGQLVRTLNHHSGAVRDLAVQPNDNGPLVLASAGADGTVRLWQPEIGRLMRFARLESAPLAIAWTPQGDLLLAACEDGRLRTIDPLTVKVVQDSPAIEGWAYAVAASPDGERAVVAGENGQLRSLPITRPAEPPR